MEPTIDKATLEKITDAAKRQIDLERKIEEWQQEKTRLENELALLAGGWQVEKGVGHAVDGLIPNLLAEAGVEKLVLTGGMIVSVEPELKPPSMAAESPMRPVVIAWAEKDGHEGSIKDFIAVYLKKGDSRAQFLVDYLLKEGIEYERVRNIHPGTLKSLIKGLLEAGKPVPLAELGVQQYKKSEITMPKEK
jgi:hypothetical protein